MGHEKEVILINRKDHAQVRQLAPMLGRHAPRSPLLLRLAATAGVTVESVSRLGVNSTSVFHRSCIVCLAAM